MRILLLLLGLCLGGFLKAENALPDSIAVPAGSRISSDPLGNLFVITPTNDIIKYGADGIKTATANFKVLGNISSLDASNPFEIYVFYRDQNRILFLDNLLNPRGECDIESIGMSQIACVARSADNQIWLFDMADQKLKKYSKDLKPLMESAALSNFGVGPEISPVQILDINSSVLVLNSGRVLEFDLFANFSRTLLSDTLSAFQYQNQRILYLKNNEMQVYHTLSFRSETIALGLPPECRMVLIEKERVFILVDEYVILRSFPE